MPEIPFDPGGARSNVNPMARPIFRFSLVRCLGLVAGLCALLGAPTQLVADDSRIWTRRAIDTVCPLPKISGLDAQTVLSESWLLAEDYWPNISSPARTTLRLALRW